MAGSNAFAVAPEKSGGPTILVSNAHQPWRGPVAWYEMVVESEIVVVGGVKRVIGVVVLEQQGGAMKN